MSRLYFLVFAVYVSMLLRETVMLEGALVVSANQIRECLTHGVLYTVGRAMSKLASAASNTRCYRSEHFCDEPIT